MANPTPEQQSRRRIFENLVRDRFGGNKKDASKGLMMTPSQVSDYCNGTRWMGEKLAKKIATNAKLPNLFANLQQGRASDNVIDFTLQDVTLKPLSSDGECKGAHVYVQSYEFWRGDTSAETRRMSVSMDLLQSRGFSPDRIVSIKMPDESQAGRIRKGDYVAIDKDWNGVPENDKTYAVMVGNNYTLRKAEYLPNNKLLLKCANSDYTDVTVDKVDIPDLDILGEAITFQPASLAI